MVDAHRDLDRMLGDPKRAIRTMVIPIFIALAVVSVNQFVDTYWVSGLGVEASEAVSTISPIYGLLAAIGMGVGVGASATVSFRLGRHEVEAAGRMATGSMVLGLILSVLTSLVLALLLDPLIGFMGARGISDLCVGYVAPMLLMSPAIVLGVVIGGALRGEGSARRSTIVQVSAAVLNMVLDPILIYGLGMGVVGAGLATSVAALLALAIGLRWYLRGMTVVRMGLRDLPSRADLREVSEIAVPRSAESLVSNITDVVQRVFLVIAGGTTAVMLYNYPWRYIGLANLPSSAMSHSMIPVCSAAMGAGDAGRMREGFLYTLRVGVSCSAALAVLVFLFSEPLMSVMTYEEGMHELLPRFAWVLRMSALLIPFSAMMGIGSAMMQSMRRSRLSMGLYMGWGLTKLALYACVCTVSFEAIIHAMVAVHILGGLMMVGVAWRMFGRMGDGEAAAESTARGPRRGCCSNLLRRSTRLT